MCPHARCPRAAPAPGLYWGISRNFTNKQEMSSGAVSEDVRFHLYGV